MEQKLEIILQSPRSHTNMIQSLFNRSGPDSSCQWIPPRPRPDDEVGGILSAAAREAYQE